MGGQTSSPDPEPGQWPPPWFDPERYALVTPSNVRALTHPIRMALLRLLREQGPATATGLAGRMGVSSGLTSYHLRVLADAGMIEDDTERSNRRDRWWRAVHDNFVFTFRAPGQDGDGAQIEASARFLRMATQISYERVLSWIDELPEHPDQLPTQPWQIGDFSISVTPTEARQLVDRLLELLAPYRCDQKGGARGPGGPDEIDPNGTRLRGHIQYQVVPTQYSDPN